jgi:hypothetical protein
MKNMWIDGDRSMRRGSPGGGVERSPTVRSRAELATRHRSARVVWRVALVIRTKRGTDQARADAKRDDPVRPLDRVVVLAAAERTCVTRRGSGLA